MGPLPLHMLLQFMLISHAVCRVRVEAIVITSLSHHLQRMTHINHSRLFGRRFGAGRSRRTTNTGFVHNASKPHLRRQRLYKSSLCLTKHNDDNVDSTTREHQQHRPIRRIGIIGGGLAGLSVAYHLLDISEKNTENSDPLHIVIYDKAKVGEGGASSVAGG